MRASKLPCADNARLCASFVLTKSSLRSARPPKLLLRRNMGATSSSFSTRELSTLKRMFKHLAALSPDKKSMDRHTFLKLFEREWQVDGTAAAPMPHSGPLISERMFAFFDKNKSGTIDMQEWLVALSRFMRGSEEDFLRVVFEVCRVRDLLIERSSVRVSDPPAVASYADIRPRWQRSHLARRVPLVDLTSPGRNTCDRQAAAAAAPQRGASC